MSAENRRTAVVIGGGSGIGRATVDALVERGDRVVIADLNLEAAQAAADEVGGEAREVNVTDEESVRALFDELAADGTLGAVVNTAGANQVGLVTEQPIEEWRQTIDLCLTGSFLVIKHAGRVLPREGSIVTISSLNGKQAAVGMAAYCSAKAGLEMLTEVAALELGPRGVRVNTVAPGLINTPLVAGIFALPGMEDEFLDNTPLGRVGDPADVAQAVAYLCEPGSWVTGVTLAVDGGARMRRYPALVETLQQAMAAQAEATDE